MSFERLIPPEQKTVARVLEIVERFGLRVDADTVAVIVAARDALLFETSEGRQTLAEKCKMEIVQGESDMEYMVVDSVPRLTEKGDKVFFLNAVVINGEFQDPRNVDGYHLEKEMCESCGVNSHCLVKTKDEMGRNAKLCNHCMHSSAVQRLKDESQGYDGCNNCSVIKCPNHPQYHFSGEWIKKG